MTDDGNSQEEERNFKEVQKQNVLTVDCGKLTPEEEDMQFMRDILHILSVSLPEIRCQPQQNGDIERTRRRVLELLWRAWNQMETGPRPDCGSESLEPMTTCANCYANYYNPNLPYYYMNATRLMDCINKPCD